MLKYEHNWTLLDTLDTIRHDRTQPDTAGHDRTHRTQLDMIGHSRTQPDTAGHSRTQPDTKQPDTPDALERGDVQNRLDTTRHFLDILDTFRTVFGHCPDTLRTHTGHLTGHLPDTPGHHRTHRTTGHSRLSDPGFHTVPG